MSRFPSSTPESSGDTGPTTPEQALPARVELLAPAGHWEPMRAAIANGADAVYFGLDNYNARHRAENFRKEELPEIMSYLRGHNVRGFLTLNTLIFSDELPELADWLSEVAAAGVDAVIVQDLGLAGLIHAMTPGLTIHGSTQMTLTDPLGIEAVRPLGVKRVVVARELSVDDIRRIRQGTDMPLEVFIHGAMCVAYSGQCLTSESLGGRSANRGQCAQACRLPYDLMVDGEAKDNDGRDYLLSPQDLAAHDMVGRLVAEGVAGLKIEGRLKSAHYVAATTRAYRQAVDAAVARREFSLDPESRGDLEQAFSRGFTNGFLDGVNHQRLVAGRFPKSRGRRIGLVEVVLPASVTVRVDTESSKGRTASGEAGANRGNGPSAGIGLKPGDGVVFDEGHPEQDEQGGRVVSVTTLGPGRLRVEFRRGDVNTSAVAPGAIVWKTDDPALRRRLEHTFSRDLVANRLPLTATVTAKVGQRLVVRLDAVGIEASAESDEPLAAADRRPVTREAVWEQLKRLGDTPFELTALVLHEQGSPMVPASLLNALRRKVVDELVRQRQPSIRVVEPDALSRLRRQAAEIRPPQPRADQLPATIAVLVRTLEQLHAMLDAPEGIRPERVYCDFEDVRKYDDSVIAGRAAAMPIGLATLRILMPTEHGLVRKLADASPDLILVRNLGSLELLRGYAPSIRLVGDYSLNVTNELTAAWLAGRGLGRLVPGYDMNWSQLQAMLRRIDPGWFELVVHQHMPMFHMNHCVFAAMLSDGRDHCDCGRPCDRHAVDLRDRVGQSHPLIPDVGCRNTVYNAQPQSAMEYLPRMVAMGLRSFRLELLREDRKQSGELLRQYANVLSGKTESRSAVRSLRVLNQLGVTRGTLDRE